ncbi:unnamed protein product [Caenorhabditis bovis]|uniref:Serpin domain-containing protein n=1 Tax=Caenorhabditis bovis TaxID=2654633 RepID=A0A8S1EKR5_9PELO|nr:unnamed protein product [Caenorhabditis bovis]
MFRWKSSSEKNDICFNPLQAIRAWSLLANVAEGKTYRDIIKYIVNRTNIEEPSNLTELNKTILGLHVEIEEDVDGCVRLFTELPKHLINPSDLENSTRYYGGKSDRSAIRHLCFASDPDGLFSCDAINTEVFKSSRGAVKFVVPEQYAPTWRSQMALVSCSDCTFHWKTTDTIILTDNMLFTDDCGNRSYTSAILARADVHKSPNGKIYRLESQLDDFQLYLSMTNEPLSLEDFKETETSDRWHVSKNRLVLLPRTIISTPLSLLSHAKKDGLQRLFCSEKSELFKLTSNMFEIKANFITTNPPIIMNPTSTGFHANELLPEHAHVAMDECLTSVLASNQRKTMMPTADTVFMYYEDHLDKRQQVMERLDPFSAKAFHAPEGTLEFNTTFQFIVTRHCENEPIVLCAGRFNNSMWTNDESSMIEDDRSDSKKLPKKP